jgi:transcriptional antiterminator NusG
MTEKSKEPCWYVVHTYSGYENKVKDTLEKSIENNGMQDLIFDVRVPVEDVVEIKNGKRVKTQRKVFPGYVLVHMIETTRSWYVVRNTRGVTGFVGTGSKPTPLPDSDFAALMESTTVTQLDIQVGDEVRILSGLFENFNGRVTEIDEEKQRVRVVVPMMKRDTAVELSFDEVLRLEN